MFKNYKNCCFRFIRQFTRVESGWGSQPARGGRPASGDFAALFCPVPGAQHPVAVCGLGGMGHLSVLGSVCAD